MKIKGNPFKKKIHFYESFKFHNFAEKTDGNV